MRDIAGDAWLDAFVHEEIERSTGVLEPDQPTDVSHALHLRAMQAKFTPRERRLIRDALGLDPHYQPTKEKK